MPKLSDIAGIGPKHQAKLKKANVNSVETLLQKAATPKGRAELQSDSGIDGDLILDWANRADLLRIRGIGSSYSELLAEAGIHNVQKLASRQPETLHRTLAKKNSALGNKVTRLPGEKTVRAWVEDAVKLLAASEPSGPGGGRPGGKTKISDLLD